MLVFWGFGGGVLYVVCGVCFWVFPYVGEGNIFPCQGVMHFGADSHFWGLKINLQRLFLG